MFHYLIKIRFLFILAVIFILGNSCVFLAQGVIRSFHAYSDIIHHGVIPTTESKPGIKMLESLDSFMVAFVFMSFGLGIGKLFIYNGVNDSNLPSWLRISDFRQLKILLWESILLLFVIYTLGDFVEIRPSTWESMVPPLIILILSLALFFMRKENHSH